MTARSPYQECLALRALGCVCVCSCKLRVQGLGFLGHRVWGLGFVLCISMLVS